MTLSEVKKEEILRTIMECGSIARAAIKLEISRRTIHRLLNKHNLKSKVGQITAELRKQRCYKQVGQNVSPT